jgi:hypothetical protein
MVHQSVNKWIRPVTGHLICITLKWGDEAIYSKGPAVTQFILKEMKYVIFYFVLALIHVFPSLVSGQAAPDTTFDLSRLANGETWAIFNRTVTPSTEEQKTAVYFDDKLGQGLAWMPSLDIGDGIIEVDVKGRNDPGKSFVGLAFHGIDAEHFEAVYLRPFNFNEESETSRSHSVQYVLVPSHEWSRLRDEHPGQYEAAIPSAPSPDAWVHLRLELTGPEVRVFIDQEAEPVLVVDRIGAEERGWIGLWVGFNSDGMFANLKVSPK